MRLPFRSVNPSTEETFQQYDDFSQKRTLETLDRASKAFMKWRSASFDKRAAVLRLCATILRNRSKELSTLMAREMGKPLPQGEAEAEKCAWVCDYYAQHAESFLADMHAETDASKSYVAFRPLGVVLGIMPWNFPLWQVWRFIAPTLMAGNTVLLKHAPNVTGCAIAIQQILEAARLPSGVFDILLIHPPEIAELIAHPSIAAVTLTGSVPAGRAIASVAGQHLKKTVLELGGSDPYVILDDADIELAAEACMTSRLINSGQSCIAAKRFIVVKSRRKVFEEAVTEKMKSKTFGDPIREPSDLGPMARADLRDALHDQVTRSIEMGARALCGAALPYRKGYFYPPTVLTGVTKGMPAFDEETFGPVAAIVQADDDEHAIALANDTPFGLGAAIFSKDIDRAERIAREHLNAGSCFVNAYVKSDPRLPFGGIKISGYGRELGLFGIREFVNTKTVYCR
jgi:succinate-semialdehyde dehydrogenase/glutarate-semialdehyde dehydrogenase